MQEPSTSSNQPNSSVSGEEINPNDPNGLQDPSKLSGRRNALTPESHNIEPIRQTEIQEKMSNLTMAGPSTSQSSDHSGG